MNNYEYCAAFAADGATGPDYAVLDYGCGGGRIVSLMRTRGLDAYGCDVFYGGSQALQNVPPELLDTAIRKIEDDRIPFPDEHFDLVVTNQVLEHVKDLDLVLREIHRVLKPGGRVLALFPDRGTWLEGHCGVPFLHRFPKGSGSRVGYALLWRTVGFGKNKAGKSRLAWSRHMCNWLDQWTHYRGYGEVRRLFDRYCTDFRHLEHERLDSRLGPSHPVTRLAPRWLKRLVTNKVGGLVVTCAKGSPPVTTEDRNRPPA
ncbi:MAG: class I SAM-dependent methyltransferase [bacterium]|nr:class I SAM-dependent methyltransferase [bacterium]